MIHQFVNCFFLLSFRCDIEFGDHFDSAVRTSQFTGRTAGATVFIIFIMRHHHFTFETISKFQRIAVIRILLRDDLLMMRKIITGAAHAHQ